MTPHVIIKSQIKNSLLVSDLMEFVNDKQTISSW